MTQTDTGILWNCVDLNKPIHTRAQKNPSYSVALHEPQQTLVQMDNSAQSWKPINMQNFDRLLVLNVCAVWTLLYLYIQTRANIDFPSADIQHIIPSADSWPPALGRNERTFTPHLPRNHLDMRALHYNHLYYTRLYYTILYYITLHYITLH